MIEGRNRLEDFLSFAECSRSHGGISLLGDQFCRTVRRKFLREEEISDSGDVAQQSDALTDQRSDETQLFRRDIRKPGLLSVRRQAPHKLIETERTDMLGIQP